MNQDDIIRMARDACPYTTDEMRGAFYEGFLKGTVAEREACAQVCEEYENDMGYGQPQKCADAIRARGNK